VFDLNDFDETTIGPWEWDLKRLAASVVVAGRVNGISDTRCRDAAISAAGWYRKRMRQLAKMRFTEVWYSSVAAANVTERLNDDDIAADVIARAHSRTQIGTLTKLVDNPSSELRIKNDLPLIDHRTFPVAQRMSEVWSLYRKSLTEERRVLLDRYQPVDIVRQVVGVGSVGLRTYLVLLAGSDDADPLFLQIKEATASVLAPYIRPSRFANEGKRVASGQRVMQAASDLFLGWTHLGVRDYYVRQFRDMKASIPTCDLDSSDMATYAGLCGRILARAHACSFDPALIAGYLGTGEVFDNAIAAFAMSYADQTERDHEALLKAVRSGRIAAETGI
jgi:uncharacterized protein (DUF2252 family)